MRYTKSHRTLAILGTLVLAGIHTSGCQNEEELPQRVHVELSASLRALDSCAAYEDEVAKLLTSRVIEHAATYSHYYPGGPDVGAPPMQNEDSAGGEALDYTGTNLQEAGVDEADILKTDGEHIYVQSGQDILILKANPPEDTELIGNVPLKGVNAELLLFDDQLVVISQDRTFGVGDDTNGACGYGGSSDMVLPGPDFGGDDFYCNPPNAVRIERWDVSDPTDAKHIQAVDLEGQFITSRAIDGELYIVHSFSPAIGWSFSSQVADRIKLLETLGDRTGDRRRAKLESMRGEIFTAVQAALAEHPVALRPQHRINDKDVGELGACNQVFVPEASASAIHSLQLLQIAGLDLRDPEAQPNTVSLLSDGWMSYASPTAFYIAQGSHNWSWHQNTAHYETTDIHKFDIRDARPSYAASGRVNGYARDRFVMSERDEIFRIATTDRTNRWRIATAVSVGRGDDVAVSPPVSSEPSGVMALGLRTHALSPVAPPPLGNNLYTLRQNGRSLDLYGRLEGFGVTEQIYGTRYVDDMAYIVTFRQTDPLFSIDLSDPANPTVRGELKIPGFSNFLQSIGDGWLVGIGQEADEQGFIEGFQVQLFDVRDPDAPIRAHQHLVRVGDDGYHWSSSEAEYESRAFTWYPSQNLLSIPVSIQSMDEAFHGLIVFHITPEDGITEVGRVDHSSLLQTQCDADPDCHLEQFYHYAQMRRSAFIGDYVYALSSAFLSVSTIESVSVPVFTLEL